MPHKAKISSAEKERIVQQCESGELSIASAAVRSGAGQTTIREWISQYRSEGVGGLESAKRNRVYSPELKQEAVTAYLSDQGSLQKLCELFHIRSAKQLREWIKVYNSGKNFTNKMSGGSRMKSTRKTTQEERIQIAKECIESENNYGLIAKKHGVSYQQARTWALKYRELGDAGLEDRRGKATAQQQPRTAEETLRIRVAQLERQLYLAEMENNVLKKLQEIERRDALDK